jgi:N-methylhydantoinase B
LTYCRPPVPKLLSINTAGGYGDPHRRPRDLIERDIADGKISPERAREAYGGS